MTSPGEPSPADQRRLAQIFLAALDNDRAACDQAEQEIEFQDGGWQRAFAGLAHTHIAMLVASYGEDLVRRSFEATAWDASLYERS